MAVDVKAEAVRCWTHDPCGAIEGEPGTAEYAARLVDARRTYGPWFASALDYAGANGLDVLDVGCGQGIDLIEYARSGARVTGVDLTPRHVELARAHLTALGLEGRVVEGDAEQLPFPDGSFDRVSSNGVLHHTPDLPRALREIRRVLRPGGRATVIVYNRHSLHYWLWQLLWERLHHRPPLAAVERSSVGARPLVRVFSPAELRRLLRSAGFAKVTTEVTHFHAGDIPYGHRLQRVLPERLLARTLGWYVVGRGVA